jgi:biopolymer transport protein TolQ
LDSSVAATNLAAPTGDLSLITLFLQADIVVKFVMLLLVIASVWVWAIVFEKITTLRRVNRLASTFEDRFWSGGSLEDL